MNSYYLKRGSFKTSLFIATTAILMLEHRSSEIERPNQSTDPDKYESSVMEWDPYLTKLHILSDYITGSDYELGSISRNRRALPRYMWARRP